MTYFYKVKHKPTGKFWKGGDLSNNKRNSIRIRNSNVVSKERMPTNILIDEKFTKEPYGKTWVKEGLVKSAFSTVKSEDLKRLLMAECVVVKYKAEEIEQKNLIDHEKSWKEH